MKAQLGSSEHRRRTKGLTHRAKALLLVGSLLAMVAVVVNPLAPQSGASIKVTTDDGTTLYEVSSTSTYMHQLAAFRDAIVDAKPFPTTVEDGVRNMAIIDACYIAAGLQPLHPLRRFVQRGDIPPLTRQLHRLATGGRT